MISLCCLVRLLRMLAVAESKSKWFTETGLAVRAKTNHLL